MGLAYLPTFTHNHKNQPNVGKHIIHWVFGLGKHIANVSAARQDALDDEATQGAPEKNIPTNQEREIRAMKINGPLGCFFWGGRYLGMK